MPNLTAVLKSEISRLARKELRSETDTLRKQAAAQRAEIATLKRRVLELEKGAARLGKIAAATKGERAKAVQEQDAKRQLRFSASNLLAMRQRLAISAADLGRLLEVTGQTIRNWESGKTVPGRPAVAAIAQVRRLGKRGVAEQLATMKPVPGESAEG